MADATQATQASSAAKSLPARKSFIHSVRALPKLTKVWIQGLIVWKYGEGIAVDDGTGIARVAFLQYDKMDIASPVTDLRVGMYVMVVGDYRRKLVRNRIGIRAMTVRDLTLQGPLMESLWALEVADAVLRAHDKSDEMQIE